MAYYKYGVTEPVRKEGAVVVLITKGVREKLPKLYSQEHEADPVIQVKFFYPGSRYTWYAYEGEEQDGDYLMFGYVEGNHPQDDELGYFSANELAGVRGPLSLKVERDLHFTPCKLSEVRGY